MLTDNDEFQRMIDESFEKALKTHVHESPSVLRRLLEGVAVGVIVMGIGWAVSQYSYNVIAVDGLEAQNSNNEVSQQYAKKAVE